MNLIELRRKPDFITGFFFNSKDINLNPELQKLIVLRLDGFAVKNILHNSWIKFEDGDFIRVNKDYTDCYPISKDKINELYYPLWSIHNFPFVEVVSRQYDLTAAKNIGIEDEVKTKSCLAAIRRTAYFKNKKHLLRKVNNELPDDNILEILRGICYTQLSFIPNAGKLTIYRLALFVYSKCSDSNSLYNKVKGE